LKLLLFEAGYKGHRLPYLAKMLPAFIDVGAEVTIALPADCICHEEYQQNISPFENQTTIDAWLPSFSMSPAKKSITKVKLLKNAIARSKPDHLVIPHADGLAQSWTAMSCVKQVSFPKELSTEILVMRGSFAYTSSGWKQKLAGQASRWAMTHGKWDRVHLIDPLVYEAIKPDIRRRQNINLLPDAVEPPIEIDPKSARSELGIPTDGRYMVAVGALDERKGIDRLVHAMTKAKLSPDDRLLLAGRMSDVVQEAIKQAKARGLKDNQLIEINRFVSDRELALAIASSDVLVTPYPRHVGSASIVIRAAAANKYVLASDYGWVRWAVERFDLGLTTNVMDEESLINAIPKALEASASHQINDEAKKFAEFHSVANFQAHWTLMLREKMNLEPSSEYQSWPF